MRTLFRSLVAIAATCVVLILVTVTFTFLKKVIGKSTKSGTGHVAVLDISGVIMSSSSFLKEIREVLENTSAKALIVRINSPGGLVAPSQEMFEALRKADQKIPVIISMSSLAASGGYYAALGGRKIYADPGTLTASIGVIMEFMNTEKLFAWAKVERVTLKAGKFKDIGSPTRPMRPEERDLLEAMLKDIHTQFRATVKERRKLTDAEIETYCDGRIMTGQQAKVAKLVDDLGGFEDALKEARALAHLAEDSPVDYPEEDNTSLVRKFVFGSKADAQMGAISQGISEIVSQQSVNPGWRVMFLAPLH